MQKRNRMKYPRQLSDLLGESLSGSPLGQRLHDIEIWNVWTEAVGPVVAERAQPLRFNNGVLTVVVTGGPWMQELRFLSGVMRNALNQRLGRDAIKEIMLRAGTVSPSSRIGNEEPPLPRKRLSLAVQKQIETCAAPLEDSEMREAFAALMRASLSHVK